MTGLVRRYIDKMIGLCKLDLHKSIFLVINESLFAFDFLIIVPQFGFMVDARGGKSLAVDCGSPIFDLELRTLEDSETGLYRKELI